MLVPFLVDPQALVGRRLDHPLERSIHERLLEKWARYGILMIPEASFGQSGLCSALDELPQNIRILWKNAVSHSRIRELCLNAADNVFHDQEGLRRLSDAAKLACLDEVKACVFGVPAEEHAAFCMECNMELCRFDCADRAESFKSAEALSSGIIKAGTAIGTVWDERFSRLAAESKFVTVVDRYGAKAHVERRDGKSGLTWFLRALGRDGRKHTLNLYVSRADKTAQTIEKEIAGIRVAQNIRSIHLHIVEENDFKRIAHGRFIRFNDTTCVLDTGLEVFSGTEVYRDVQLATMYSDEAFRNCERTLRGCATSICLR